MRILKILIIYFFPVISTNATAQVNIRLFSIHAPESVVFSVMEGTYEINSYNGESIKVTKTEPVVIFRFDGKLAVNSRKEKGFLCDSVKFEGKTGNDSFALRINGDEPIRQYYSGDLHCFPDLGTLVLINICDIEHYISGVVRTEGGLGQNIEYFKTQAVIGRTYMYKYFDKHLADGYNVCDNTHCQAFNGLSYDSIIHRAVTETRDMVIMTPDSSLILSAFHSNCGGETSSSEDVWLTSQPYLKSIVDPYCLVSRNSKWERSISMEEWYDYIRKSGYEGISNNPEAFSFVQKSRLSDYKTESVTIPLRTIRTEKNLRSTFFSVVASGDSIILEGRGYGHGVGLCQEGAMAMADRGFTYNQIIDFYYTGVFVSNIKNAVILTPVNSF